MSYQLAVILLGLWIMASPDLMSYEGPERLNNHIVGPLVVSMGIIALAETTRAVRWVIDSPPVALARTCGSAS